MDPVAEYLSQYAAGAVALIGRGMEGDVYDLGGELVAKVWADRQPADVLSLQAFAVELAAQDLPFHTPDLRSVETVAGRVISVEKRLPGTPLRDALADGRVTQEQGLDAFVQVVAALGRVPAGPASKALPVIDDLFWPGRASWGEAWAQVVRRRAAASRGHLEGDVPGFDRLLGQVLRKLTQVEVETLRVVHGDICTPNLLVDEDGRTTALLDWGFCTTAGDNTFDASTAAGFYDMYGPDAHAIDDLLLDRFEAAGHSRDRMYLYRAAYAISTATIYALDAKDDHYRWCTANLNRPELRAAL